MHKIPIVMPIYNRPDYLSQVLEGVRRCPNIDQFYIETFEENEKLGESSTIEENSKIFKNVDWIEVCRNINAGVIGCAANVVQGIDKVCLTNDYFVVLEDDIIPAIDFFNLMLFGFKHLKDEMGWVHAHSRNPKVYLQNDDLYDKVQRTHFFVPWGWGSSRGLWLKFREDFDVKVSPKLSWAIPFGIWLMKKKYFGYRSLIGRSLNIGKRGIFEIDPQRHKKEVYSEYWYAFEYEPVNEFKILNKNKTDFPNPEDYRMYMKGVINNDDFRKCFRDWEGL